MTTDELLTTQEVADHLKVALRTVYSYIDSGKLKAIRMEGLWRIRLSDLEEFLSNGETPPNTPVE